MSKEDNSRLCLEICTDNEEDWKEFLGICAIAFQSSTPFKRSHPDPGKRKLHLSEYFKYVYETELSKGRAGLVCVKKISDNQQKPKILYGFCMLYKESPRSRGDKTCMENIDKKGMEICLGEDEWLEKNIHSKMRDLSKILNFTAAYGYLQASVKEHMNNGVGSKYILASAEMLVQDGIIRGVIPAHLPIVVYGVLDDVRVKRFHKQAGSIEIAHLHFGEDDKHKCRKIKCIDNNMGDNRNEIFDCVIVVGKVLGPHKFSLPQLQTVFNLKSML
uniref:uncharacterized protein LOC120337533 n=1 Tax=Styela clava TaxID=7725 RepID=UPI001939C164|nr:uncharacterized protein LOC120337533 [Styela clava]XP_039261283.1 uncharacterized protein LOC120337533 [Styela clava]XP_039261284.1 uncharacterized protein LOC120337533 [Styela clava]